MNGLERKIIAQWHLNASLPLKKGRRRHGCNWGILQQTSKMDIRDSYDFSGQFQTRMLRILSLSFLMELWSTSIRTRLVALQQQLGLEEELS